MASLLPSSEKYSWLLIGVCALGAIYISHRQLVTFKKRCTYNQTLTGNVGVEQSTEDAIKLSTLATLARGVNPELRAAALTIITERALRDSSMQYISNSLESADAGQRLKALKALNVLTQNISPKRFLSHPRIFRALVGTLRAPGATPSSEKEAKAIILRFADYSDARHAMVEAGLVEWWKSSAERSGDNMFYEMAAQLLDDGGGRRRTRSETDAEWVEVEAAEGELSRTLAELGPVDWSSLLEELVIGEEYEDEN